MKTLAHPRSKPLRDFLLKFVRPDATVPGRSGRSADAHRAAASGLGLSDWAAEWDFLDMSTTSWRHRRLNVGPWQMRSRFRSSLCLAGAQRVVSGLRAGAQREDPTVTFGSVTGD
jgi:hypothetical protein